MKTRDLTSGQVKTGDVRDVITVYDLFYDGHERCICDLAEGEWPNLMNGTLPVVCLAHTWEAKRARLQKQIAASGLSMPVAPAKAHDTMDALVAASKEFGVKLSSNPLDAPPGMWIGKPKKRNSDIMSSAIAAKLAEEGHIVFLVHKTQAINLSYAQRDQEVSDVLIHAPVVVFWDNHDGRINGYVKSLLNHRTYGFAFVLE